MFVTTVREMGTDGRCPYRANQVREHPKDEAKADKDDAIGNKLSPSFHPLVVSEEHPLGRSDFRAFTQLPTVKVMTMRRKKAKVILLW